MVYFENLCYIIKNTVARFMSSMSSDTMRFYYRGLDLEEKFGLVMATDLYVIAAKQNHLPSKEKLYDYIEMYFGDYPTEKKDAMVNDMIKSNMSSLLYYRPE